MGGIGKSELCIKGAQLLRESFWAVFWVDIGTENSAKDGFITVAQALNLNCYFPASSFESVGIVVVDF